MILFKKIRIKELVLCIFVVQTTHKVLYLNTEQTAGRKGDGSEDGSRRRGSPPFFFLLLSCLLLMYHQPTQKIQRVQPIHQRLDVHLSFFLFLFFFFDVTRFPNEKKNPSTVVVVLLPCWHLFFTVLYTCTDYINIYSLSNLNNNRPIHRNLYNNNTVSFLIYLVSSRNRITPRRVPKCET